MRSSLTFLLVVALACLASPLLAQGGDGYGDYPQEIQTTNTPAGTAVEPGSQLLFMLNTGVDARQFDPATTLADNGITSSPFTNFIAITNTNPTDAVTVHFRYFSSLCDDVLDFLVILTCNDTMLIDAFDYPIPGTSLNVQDRFFGTSFGLIGPLNAGEFGDGRFLLFVTASGDVGNDSGTGNDTSVAGVNRGLYDGPEDLDDVADWLFPLELAPTDLDEDCPAVDPTTIGDEEGVNNNNLNVFNASSISFNYVTGYHTVAVARAGGLASHGVVAWTRPAINASVVLDDFDWSVSGAGPPTPLAIQDVGSQLVPAGDGPPDGLFPPADLHDWNAILDDGFDVDGPLAPKRVVLTGTEEIWMTLVRANQIYKPGNQYYLRQDAHGGDSVETNCEGTTANQIRCDLVNPWFYNPVIYGALAWTLFPESGVMPEDQYIYPISIKDDYNGSNNPNTLSLAIAIGDNSYRLDPAATYYQLVVFNNDEDPLIVTQDITPISPPPPFEPISITVATNCICAHRFGIADVSGVLVPGGPVTDFVFTENFGTFSVADLYTLDGKGLVAAFLAAPVNVPGELGPGWVRFDRILTRDFWYEDTAAGIIPVAIAYDGERGSYVTIGKHVLFQASFAVAWYLPQSAAAFLQIG